MDVSVDRGDGSRLRCYRVGSSGPGIVLLHAWWGLNRDIVEMAEALAAQGFQVVAPDLFDGAVASTPEAAKRLVARSESDGRRVLADVERAAARLREERVGKIGAVGLSFGAGYAVAAVRYGLDAVVLFYGTSGLAPEERVPVAVLGHFAEADPYEPDRGEAFFAELGAAGATVERHVYPGTQHWFIEPSHPNYRPEAAELAWTRTRAFLKRTLES